jgi:hypothetical protein
MKVTNSISFFNKPMVFTKSTGSEKIALLLGGCESVRANPLIAQQANVLTEKLSKKTTKDAVQQLKKDELKWASDFELIEEYFKLNNCIIWGSHPTEPRAYKADSVKLITDFFQQPATTYVIYWCGHGRRRSGNWCFAGNEDLTLTELLLLFRESFDPLTQHRNLIIISDTCHSEYWCKELIQREEYELNVLLQAASLEAERAYIVEGTKPRSSLMKKFIHELKGDSIYLWTHETQHPNVAMTECFLNRNKVTMEEIRNGETRICFDSFKFTNITKHLSFEEAKKLSNSKEE